MSTGNSQRSNQLENVKVRMQLNSKTNAQQSLGSNGKDDAPTPQIQSITSQSLMNSPTIQLRATERMYSWLRPATSNIPQLPTELWIEILSHLDRRRDLVALSRTSRRLRATCLMALFQTMDMWSYKERLTEAQYVFRLGARNPLHSPDIVSYVTNLSVHLSAWEVCPKLMSVRPAKGVCTCQSLDELLGGCILGTVNLEVLEFTCGLCTTDVAPRHQYLLELSTRKLRSLSFHCHCAPGHLFPLSKAITTPCFATLDALDWKCPAVSTKSLQRTLLETEALPNLRTLQYQGTAVDRLLLSTRPIQRMFMCSINLPDEELTEALLNTPAKFTYFSVTGISNWKILLEIKPSLFKNLRHIGTIPPYPDNQLVCEQRIGR